MSLQWYVTSGNRSLGRFRTGTLYEMIRQGRLADDDQVSADGVSWMPVADLRKVAGLAGDVFQMQAPELDLVPLTPVDDEPPLALEPLLLLPGDDADSPGAGEPGSPPRCFLAKERQGGPPQMVPVLPGVQGPPDPSGVTPGAPPALGPVSAAAPPATAAPTLGGQRDRIVILGRRAAGKTVYLATLYARLWKSLDGMTMKAASGVAHETAMLIVNDLTRGKWPAATLDNTTMVIDVCYKRRTRKMISMDYSGEVFRRAFVEDIDSTREVKELLDHLDNAGAVMLLLDPSVSSDRDEITAAVDDDFGMVQAVQRVRNWPGGESVPIVLVLTKMDQNLPLIKREGSAADFVRKHWPALTRTLGHLVIFQVSAVQVTRTARGEFVPRSDSDPVNLENPLKFCLKEMEHRDQTREHAERTVAQQERQRMEEETLLKEDRERSLLWASVVVGLLLVGLFVVAAILIFS